jgi:hypothetical protein
LQLKILGFLQQQQQQQQLLLLLLRLQRFEYDSRADPIN